MKKLLLLLLISTPTLATIGNIPSATSAAVKIHTYVCYDEHGNAIKHSQDAKRSHTCKMTGNKNIDELNNS